MSNNKNKSLVSNYSMYIDGGASSGHIDTNYYLPEGTKPKSISYWFKNVNLVFNPSGVVEWYPA